MSLRQLKKKQHNLKNYLSFNMPKNDMFHDFDPYDVIITLNERVHQLEGAHNALAHAFKKTETDLSVTLHSLRQLQQQVLKQGMLIQDLIKHAQEQAKN